ncbi:MAG: hypothetical protein ACOX9B_02380 [Candidatus Xenobium sp.]
MSTAEVRLTTQTGPSHPHPGVGGVSTDRRPNATVGGGFRAMQAADSGRTNPPRSREPAYSSGCLNARGSENERRPTP